MAENDFLTVQDSSPNVMGDAHLADDASMQQLNALQSTSNMGVLKEADDQSIQQYRAEEERKRMKEVDLLSKVLPDTKGQTKEMAGIQTQANALIDPKLYSDMTVNWRATAALMGKPLDELDATKYGDYKSEIAVMLNRPAPKSESEYRSMLSEHFVKEKDKDTALNELYGNVVLKAFQDTGMGKNRPLVGLPTEYVKEWETKHKDLIDGDAGYHAQANRVYKQTLNDLESIRGKGAETFSALMDFTQGKADDERISQVAEHLASSTPEERQNVYRYVGLAAEAGHIDRSGLEQFAINMGQSFTRGFDFIPQGDLQSYESYWRNLKKDLANGGVEVVDAKDGGMPLTMPVNQAMKAVFGEGLYNKPTTAQIATLTERADKELQKLQIVRELRNVAKSEVDPIRPVFSDSAIERGAYGLAGSLGIMVPVAINPALGALAYQAQEYDRIRIENPDIDPEFAEKLAIFEGAGNAALDRLQLGAINGKLPVFGGLLNGIKNNGLRRVLTTVGVEVLEQNLQEGAQDLIAPLTETLTAALREDMPDKDFGALMKDYVGSRAETFFAVLPLALLGGGIGTYRDLKNPAMQMADKNLEIAGFGPSQRDYINQASSMEERATRVEQEWSKRTSDNIAAGKELLAASIAEAKQSKGGDTIEVNTKPDGASEWIVRDPAGKEVARVSSEAEAATIVADRGEAEIRSQANVVADLLDSDWRKDKLPNFEARFGGEVSPEILIKEAEAKGDTKLVESIKASIEAHGANPAELSKLRILGESWVTPYGEGQYKAFVKLNEGHTALDAFEELAHNIFDIDVAEGRITKEQAREWVSQAAAAGVADYKFGTDAEVRESMAQIAQDFAHNKLDQTTLPSSFVAFLKKLYTEFVEFMRRAKLLDQAFKDGKIDAEFERYLMGKVGLSDASMIEREVNRIEGETGASQQLDLFKDSRAQPEAGADVRTIGDTKIVGPTNFSIRAHHGTPHEVDRFSTERIGTGEGAAAFGWGLYFAGNPAVAQDYRTKLAKAFGANDTERAAIYKTGNIVWGYGGYDRVLEYVPPTDSSGWRVNVQRVKQDSSGNWVDDPMENPRWHATQPDLGQAKAMGLIPDYGNLYGVTIDAEDHELMDWDKPLSEQSKEVKRALAGSPAMLFSNESTPGNNIYAFLIGSIKTAPSVTHIGKGRDVAKYLLGVGIKGIRYLDQGSRGFQVILTDSKGEEYARNSFPSKEAADQYAEDKKAEGFKVEIKQEGTSNYVIFDDKHIQITEKNGQPVNLEDIPTDQQTSFSIRDNPALQEKASDLADKDKERFFGLLEEFGKIDKTRGSAEFWNSLYKNQKINSNDVAQIENQLSEWKAFYAPKGKKGSSKKSKAAPKSPIQDVLDRYNDGDESISTPGDVVNELDGLAGELDNQELEDAVREYRDARRDEVEMYGERGGSDDAAFESLVAVAQKIASEQTTSFSIRARDEAYDAAVKSGDEAEMQRLVDEAAREAFPNTLAIIPPTSSKQDISKQPLKIVYHGTGSDFTEFKSGLPTADDWGLFGNIPTERHAIFFAEEKDFANEYAKARDSERIIPAYLNAENPLVFDDAFDKYDELIKIKDPSDEQKKDRQTYKYIWNLRDKWEAFDGESGKEFVDWMRKKGYDSAILSETGHGIEGEPTQDVWAVLDPSQIKSADPITRDDAGNVIPLSQRFNPESNDIRYSIQSQEQIDRVNKAVADTTMFAEGRMALYEKAKERFKKVLAENKEILDALKEGGAAPEKIRRQKLIQGIAELEVILRQLPAEVRGKVGGFGVLARGGTGDASLANFFKNRLQIIDRELEKHLSKEYLEKIEATLQNAKPRKGPNGVKKSTLGAVTQEFADKAYEASLLDNDATVARLESLEKQIAKADDPKKEADLVDEWAITNTFGSLAEQSSSKLKSALDFLKKELAGGRAARKAAEEARIDDIREKQGVILDALPGWTDSGLNKVNSPGWWQETKDLARQMVWSHASYEQILRRILPPEAQGIVEEWSNRIRRANAKTEAAGLKNWQNLIQAIQSGFGGKGFMKTADALSELGEKRDGKVSKLEGREVELESIPIDKAEQLVRGEMNRGDYTKANLKQIEDALIALPLESQKKYISIYRVIKEGRTESIPMTLDEMIFTTMAWDQADVRVKMENSGWTQESYDAMQKEIASSKVATAVKDYLKDFYRNSTKEINPVYSRMFGMGLPDNPDYAPTSYESRKASGEMTMDGSSAQNTTTPGFAKARVTHNEAFKITPATQIYQQRSAEQAQWVAFAELHREMNAVLNGKNVRLSMKQDNGKRLSELMSQVLDNIAKGGGVNTDAAYMKKWLGAATSGTAVASMGYNLKSFVNQFDSVTRFLYAMPLKDVMRAISNPQKVLDSVPKAWNSEVVQNRILQGSNPAARFALKQAGMTPSKFLSAWYGVGAAGLQPMQYGDGGLTTLSSAIVYSDAHAKALKAGLSEADADARALDAMDAAIWRFSQPVMFSAKSPVENNSHAAMKLLYMFASDARLKTGILIDAVQSIKDGKGSRADHLRRIGVVFLGAMLAQTVSNIYRDIFSDDDDDEIWTAGGYARAVALAPFQGFFLLGTAIDVGVSALTGQKAYTNSSNPLVTATGNAITAGKHASDILQTDDMEAFFKELGRIARAIAVTPITAVPAAVLNPVKPIVGAKKNMDKGE